LAALRTSTLLLPARAVKWPAIAASLVVASPAPNEQTAIASRPAVAVGMPARWLIRVAADA
jgi:hypothetical protein